MSLAAIGSQLGQQVQGTYTFKYTEASREESISRFEDSNGRQSTRYSSSTEVSVSQISIKLSGEQAELEELFSQLDSLFRDAADRAFTNDEEDFLDALEAEIDERLGETPLEAAANDPFANLPPEILEQLEAAEEAIALLYAAADNGKLSEKQLDELDELDSQLDTVLSTFDAPDEDAFSFAPQPPAFANPLLSAYQR